MDQSFASMMNSKYFFSQVKGKRVYGPPQDWTGPPPPIGSQIFIGNLPYDVNEQELMPLCEKFGNVYQISIAIYKRKPQKNEAFGFVMFNNSQVATRAVEFMNGYEIRPHHHITVAKAKDNRRLFLSKLPCNKTKEEIMAEIKKHTAGLIKVITVPFFPDYVFADYETADAANLALGILKSANFFDKAIQCKIAHPDAIVPESLEDIQDLETEQYNPELPGTSASDTMPVPPESFFPSTDSLSSSSEEENILTGTKQALVPVELYFPVTDSLSSSSDEPSSF